MQHPVDDRRQRVAALETWQQWAIGGQVDRNSLRRAIDDLTSVDGVNHTWTNQLADSLQQWARPHQVRSVVTPSRGLDLGAECVELEL